MGREVGLGGLLGLGLWMQTFRLFRNCFDSSVTVLGIGLAAFFADVLEEFRTESSTGSKAEYKLSQLITRSLAAYD